MGSGFRGSLLPFSLLGKKYKEYTQVNPWALEQKPSSFHGHQRPHQPGRRLPAHRVEPGLGSLLGRRLAIVGVTLAALL